jgi:HD-like signal output (HDOD) protein
MVFMALVERQQPKSEEEKRGGCLHEGIANFLHSSCQARTFQAGDTIADAGSKKGLIYYLVKGSFSFELSMGDSSERFLLKENHFLAPSIFLGIPNTSFVIKGASEGRLLEIEADKLELFPERVQVAVLRELHLSDISFCGRLLLRNASMARNLAGLMNYVVSVDSRLKEATASQVIQDLISKIPKLPNFAFDLISKLQDRSVETKEVVSSIQSDPSLASLILKTINSSYYGLTEKISDLYRAVLLLGFNNIYQLILSQGLSSIMPKDPESLEIQAHSSLISVFSQEIATMSGKVNPPKVSTQALLHDIGKIVVLLLKNKYANIRPLFDLLDTSLIGARLLRAWGLPESICDVVEQQARAQFVPAQGLNSEYRTEMAVLYLAHVCHDHYAGDRPPVETFVGEYLSLLGFPSVSGREFAMEKLMPTLLAGFKRYPEHIRNFVKKAASSGRASS